MEEITGYLTAHPAVFKMMVIFALVIIAYFIFKQFLKLSLILLLIVLAIAGYHYFKNPQKMSENVQKSIDTVKSGVEKSKSFYHDSKKLIDKAKDMPGDVDKLIQGSEDKKNKNGK
jgi:hypothetical protein